MNYEIILLSRAEKDISELRESGNKAVLVKLDKLLNELREHPYTGIGKPEPLKYDLKGCWSRRINQKHRLVYKVDDGKIIVVILSATSHYDEK